MRSREAIQLDGEWEFVADPERLYTPSTLPAGQPITVPGCWEAQVPRPYRIITAWYRRPVVLPADWSGYRAILRFGAVMYRCVVLLNGRPVGEHEGGYTPFEIDLAPAARFGSTNDLIVRVVNPLNAIDEYPAFSVEEVLLAQQFEPDLPLSEAPHGKQTWYSSTSGIWQSVRLERRPPLALEPLRVRPNVADGLALVSWALDGNGANGATGARLELRLFDPDGREVGMEIVEHAAAERTGVARIRVPEPRLWDIGRPNLYRVEATLAVPGGPGDAVSARFGMREIRTEDGRILLNGRPIYLLGALDQDHYPDTISTPPSRAYLDEQCRLALEMGLNLLRCHIKVPDPAYFDAADEAGLLVWAELPNWTRFTTTAAARGRATLESMVDELGNHPSIVIWTIINEDWGTHLRYEARDRLWLLDTVEWLKARDPTRLVVDNSACDTPAMPNFHLRSDLADFHVYFLAPDNAVRWRNMIDEIADRPNWLWSPHGDAVERGDEPVVLSEFGSWGLPRLDRLVAHHRREPWWFGTGRHYYLPTGVGRRFSAYGLDRVWPDVNELAEATQVHQFESLQYEIGQLRRHDSIQGYVITELTDAYWEANGLLDPMRGRKVFHERLREINGPDAVLADMPRRDLWGGERIAVPVDVSSFGEPAQGGAVEWRLVVDHGPTSAGRLPVETWPRAGSARIGAFDLEVPDIDAVADARLTLRLVDGRGTERAIQDLRLAIVPPAARRSSDPLTVAVHDPLDIWGLFGRVEALGHRLDSPARADLLVSSEVTDDVIGHLEQGGRALVLVRTRSAIPDPHDLARRVTVHLRRLPHSGWPGQRSPWEGDWVTAWSWVLHDELPGLPVRNPLDFAYEQVLPDHVLLGYDPRRHRDEVPAGMFVGWVHTPGAIVWTFRQGRGAVTLTTFRVAPEAGPVATLLLEQLMQRARRAERRSLVPGRDGGRAPLARREHETS